MRTTPLSISAPAVIGERPVRRSGLVNTTTAAQSPRDSLSATRSAGERVDLAPLLESVFDAELDRLIYEVLDFGEVARLPSASIALAATPSAVDAGSWDVMFRAPGTGLLTALGCVDARSRIGDRRWIVLVCDGSPPPPLWSLLSARRPDSLRKFLVVLRTDAPFETQEPALDVAAGLSLSGWRVEIAPEFVTSDDLRRDLRALAAADDAPTLLVVSRSGTWLPRPVPTSARGGAAPSTPDEIEVRLVDELSRALAVDRRLVPVLTTEAPPWNRLAADHAATCVSLAPGELLTAIPWCAALADSGCHPVVVLTQHSLERWAQDIVRELSGVGRSATLIVREGPADEGARAGRAELDVPPSLPCLPGANVCALRSGDDGARALVQSFSAACTSVLWVTAAGNAGPRHGNAPERLSLESDAPSEPASAGTGVARWQERPFAVSHDVAQSDQQAIRSKSLRPDVWRWVNEYNHVGLRDLYLWRWCLHGIELTTFPSVPAEWLVHVHDTKLLSVILCVLFDDVADRRGRTEFLELLLQGGGRGGPCDSADLTEPERNYIKITRRLWQEYESRVDRYPLSGEYARLLKFDLTQFVNTMRYAHLVNTEPGLLSPTEHDVYTPHNMMMVSFSTIDLMCSPEFDRRELGTLREAMWHAQSMGRIGNILSTWRRELSDADYTSGVGALAGAAFGESGSRAADDDGAQMERRLLTKWEWHRARCHAAARSVRSIDLAGVLEGHDRFLDMHLISAGLI